MVEDALTGYRERMRNTGGGVYGTQQARHLGMTPQQRIVPIVDWAILKEDDAGTNHHQGTPKTIKSDSAGGTNDHQLIAVFESPLSSIAGLFLPTASISGNWTTSGGSKAFNQNLFSIAHALLNVPVAAGNTFGVDAVTWTNAFHPLPYVGGTSTLYATASNFTDILANPIGGINGQPGGMTVTGNIDSFAFAWGNALNNGIIGIWYDKVLSLDDESTAGAFYGAHFFNGSSLRGSKNGGDTSTWAVELRGIAETTSLNAHGFAIGTTFGARVGD